MFRKRPNAKVVQEYCGVELVIHTPAMACASCGWLALANDGQLDELLKRTKAAVMRKQRNQTQGAATSFWITMLYASPKLPAHSLSKKLKMGRKHRL